VEDLEQFGIYQSINHILFANMKNSVQQYC